MVYLPTCTIKINHSSTIHVGNYAIVPWILWDTIDIHFQGFSSRILSRLDWATPYGCFRKYFRRTKVYASWLIWTYLSCAMLQKMKTRTESVVTCSIDENCAAKLLHADMQCVIYLKTLVSKAFSRVQGCKKWKRGLSPWWRVALMRIAPQSFCTQTCSVWYT